MALQVQILKRENSIRRSLNKEDAANGFIRLELPIRSENLKKMTQLTLS
jgi:hypothetical protein